jgi:hypothetical protein
MRFRVSALALKLASQITASRVVLRLSYNRLQLALGNVGLKLSVAVGLFIKFVRLNDQSVADDQQIAKDTTRVITPDTFKALDSPVKLTNKSLAHGAGLDDGSPYFAEDYIVGAPDLQNYTFDSQIFFNVTKPFSEQIIVASAPLLIFNKTIFDNVDVNDEVDGSVSGADVELEFFKSTDNTPKFFDQQNIFVGSVLANTANLADTGFLRSQNYTVDMSYFAEDYVGESRAFS